MLQADLNLARLQNDKSITYVTFIKEYRIKVNKRFQKL